MALRQPLWCRYSPWLSNGSKALTCFLFTYIKALSLRRLNLNNGILHNAILRKAFTVVAVPTKNTEPKYLAMLHNELSSKEKSITLFLESTASASLALSSYSQQQLLCY